jgi:hypothetical protein
MSVPEPEPVRQPTPLTSPMNSDDEGMSEDQRKMVNLGKKMAKKGTKIRGPPRSGSAPEARAPTKKAATHQEVPAPQPVPEAKASTPRKGQESPETNVSKPIQARRQAKQASGAAGLRGVVGSGQTETGVLQKATPSKT